MRFNKKKLCVLGALLASSATVSADQCALGSQEIGGNWFCQPVKAIQYSNVGIAGTYQQITNMASDGTCSSTTKHFSGPLSPLDEEVSLHFRGPIQLKQFAAYTPLIVKSIKKARDTNVHQRAHQHIHNRMIANANVHGSNKRQEVTATIDGKVVSWENNYVGPPTQAPGASSPCVPPAMVTATIDGQVQTWVNNWFGGGPAPSCTSSEAPAPALAPPAAPQPVVQPAAQPLVNVNQGNSQGSSSLSAPAAHDAPAPQSGADESGQTYERIGYYDSASQTNDNLVFLANHGGAGSGVFDYNFGASLSYVNSAGTAGAASAQTLADTTVPSGSEFTIMLAQECGESDCGYVRPGSVAYHGFAGADKVFLFEYAMPLDGKDGFEGDMPSIWMLNAQIPRTTQYGPPSCNCWTTGCGEFDIAESLLGGSKFLKSTLHANPSGGDSDYLERPTSGTQKLAVIFNSSSATINVQVLPDNTVFSETLAASAINSMSQETSSNLVSHFTVTS